jgi:hypothetical protein
VLEMKEINDGSGSSRSLDVWLYRREFLRAAQRLIPAFGRYLRRFGIAAHSSARVRIIHAWQKHFHLPESWVFECAQTTLMVWENDADARRSLEWFVGRCHNLAEEGIPIFEFQIERGFWSQQLAETRC